MHRTALVRLFVVALWLLAPGGATADSHGDLAKRLSSGPRSDADKARDADRKPAEVIAFLDVEPGMTVIDLIAAGGWYTEVLSEAVGPKGKVYAQNTEATLEFREGANDKAMTQRLAGGRLPNVERLDREIADLGIAPGSVDAAITALNFHDVYNAYGAEAAAGFARAVYVILEPGGVFGVIDHVGKPGADNTKLHRIEPDKVEQVVEAAGFTLEARSEVLASPSDDHTQNVFDEGLRGKTDRFVFLFRKPGGS